MASLDEFLGILADAFPDPSTRGKRFESYLRDALLMSPAHQFNNVWLWDDWPERDGPDVGIDLVAEDADGGLWGIQSKLYGPEASLTWKELSTWVAATRDERWSQRLLVSTTSNLSPNADRQIRGDPNTKMLLGEYLHELPVEWPDSLDGTFERAPVQEPRVHQVEAIDKICAAFENGATRAQAHMACGTGKTLVCLRAYERVAPDLAVVLVPSLSLMAETILAWTANATAEFRYLPVCSDIQVTEDKRPGEDTDITIGDLAVLDARATTDTDEITCSVDTGNTDRPAQFNLGAQFNTFSGFVAVTDESQPGAPIRVRIELDGVEVHRSDVTIGDQVPVELVVEGVVRMAFHVEKLDGWAQPETLAVISGELDGGRDAAAYIGPPAELGEAGTALFEQWLLDQGCSESNPESTVRGDRIPDTVTCSVDTGNTDRPAQFNLGAQFNTFSGFVAVTDESQPGAPIRVRIELDGVEVHRSDVTIGDQVPVELVVEGVVRMAFHVEKLDGWAQPETLAVISGELGV